MMVITMRLLKLLQTHHRHLSRTTAAAYRAKGGHDVNPGPYIRNDKPRSRFGIAERVEEAEELENNLNIDDPSFINDAHGKERWRQKRIKLKIIERKYFKPPQERNLLTWDAKEQIRYLHQEFPEEWSVERLAQSFPTSRDGVIKILGSTWTPQSLRDVVRHDRRVHKAWLALREAGHQEGGPIESRYQKLIESGQLAMAAGNLSLPLPPRKRFLEEGEKPHPVLSIASPVPTFARPKKRSPKKSSVGPLESLVKEYCEKKKQSMVIQRETEESLDYKIYRDENNDILKQVVVDMGQPITSPGSDKECKDLLSNHSAVSHTAARDTSEQIQTDKRTLFDHMRQQMGGLSRAQAEAILDGEAEIPETDDEFSEADDNYPPLGQEVERKPLRRRRTPGHGSQRDSLDMQMERLQMEGTGKINPASPSSVSDMEEASGGSTVKKYELDEERARILRQVRYDTSSRYTESDKGDLNDEEAFIYTEQSGYQFPFGRTEKDLKITVPRPHKGDSRKSVYQKGKSFYDEDGELLYRIP